jgi:hypothetical protein
VSKLERSQQLKVFLCHSSSDKAVVRTLYSKLKEDGVNPWLDEEDLLAGQDWNQEIKRSVGNSDIVIVCLSHEAVGKRGYIQKEIKQALDVADEQPEGTIFLIPLKLEECDVPKRLSHLQWVNYFEEKGYERLIRALQSRAQTLGISLSSDSDAKAAAKVPFTWEQRIVHPDGKRMIRLGFTKDYNSDATDYWQVNFVLGVRDPIDDEFKIKAEFHIELRPRDYKKAERLVRMGLSERQIELLKGPIAGRAKDLQSGTTRDREIENLLKSLLDMVS